MVADRNNHRIQVFHPNGTFALAFGPLGADRSQFYQPYAVAVAPDGRIVVADFGTDYTRGFYGANRIQVFHYNGTFALSFWLDYSPSAVAVVPAPLSVVVEPSPNGTTVQPPPPIVITPSPQGNGTRPSTPAGPVSIVVELDSDGGMPVNATLIGDAANLTINVAGLTGTMMGGTASSTVTFPPSETIVITSFAEVSFPPGVTASNVPADGMLALRISSEVRPPDDQVQGALAYGGSGRVELQRIIEVGAGHGGSGDDGTLRVTFDQPVRILLEGQADGRAFYIEGANGAITPIDAACATDDTTKVHRQLAGAGECQIDSDDGTDKIIYTYHLTRFGTVVSENGTPPPVVHTCSARLGERDLDVSAFPGGHSQLVTSELINSGSLPLAGVDLEATPWYVDWGGSSPPAADHPSLPASISVVFFEDGTFAYEMVAINEAVVARGLEGGDATTLGFTADLTPYDEVQGSVLVQYVTYLAQCRP